MGIARKKTREVKIGKISVGGENPIAVQSMCNTKTSDVGATVKQILELEEAGCEINRVAVPDMESAKAVGKIVKEINTPLVADIHYDYRIALECIKQGIDKIRVNPGNTPEEKLKEVVKSAKDSGIPIRIGVNQGSLRKDIIAKYGHSPEGMAEEALNAIKLCEELDFHDIIVSLKSSDIFQNMKANQIFSSKSDYPLHLGITEAGTLRSGTIKSSIGIGSLLLGGIGDTIRVSLSADPVEEVAAGFSMLKMLGLRKGVVVVSCPTCGRAQIDVIKTANEIEKKLMKCKKNIKVGVMGCFVNADEAKMADIGVAGAPDKGILFKNGEILREVEKDKLAEELLKEIEKI